MRFPKHLASSSEVPLPQGTIHYRERGTGEPIVFVHGALVNARPVAQGRARSWRRTSAASRPTCRSARTSVPMPADADLSPPGVAKLIADFIAALDLENVTLVGNDTGGALCQLRRHAAPRADRAPRADATATRYDKFPPSSSSSCSAPAKHPGLRVGARRSRCGSRRMRDCRSPSAGCQAAASRAEITRGWVRPVLTNAGVRRDTAKLLKGIDPRYTQEAAQQLRRRSTSRC